MVTVFQVKKVLDQMDKLGPEHKNLDDLVRATAKKLFLFDLSKQVIYAREYAAYERRCYAKEIKPISLVKFLRQRGVK